MNTALQKNLLLMMAAMMMAGAATLNHRLSMHPHMTDRTFAAASTGTMPPGVAFATVLLGGFRGLVADGLWVRASMLQEQGRYFELVQLADWITALEPRFPQVWALQAWNMAYNISVLMPDAENRWRWVMHGLDLLRERGLPATGYAPEIGIEIGLLFQHKIGGLSNDQSDGFKQRWIMKMHPLTSDDGSLLMDSSAFEDLNMNPQQMRKLEAQYGRLDWRLPHSHAVYWASQARAVNSHEASSILAQRILYQSLAVLFEKGTLTVDESANIIISTPAFELLPGALEAFEEALEYDPVTREGYVHFLIRSIQYMAFYRHTDEAKSLFERLQQRFPSALTQAQFDVFVQHPRPFLPEIRPIP